MTFACEYSASAPLPVERMTFFISARRRGGEVSVRCPSKISLADEKEAYDAASG
jgi:hypothetical protein